AILNNGDGGVGARRRIVHTGDVEDRKSGGQGKSVTATGGAAVIDHRELERGIARAIGVSRRGVDQVAEVRDQNVLTCGDIDAAKLERASGRQSGDDDGLEVVGTRRRTGTGIDRISEAEVGGAEGVRAILNNGDGGVGARRRIVHTGDV